MNDSSTIESRLLTALRALVACACVLVAGRMHGGDGLYAIAGVPLSSMGENSPIVLYRVADGGLEKVRTIATRRQNPHVVKSYPRKGFVFVVSEGAFDGSFQVDILELGDISRERSVDFDYESCTGCNFLEAGLLEQGGRLVFYILAMGDEDGMRVGHYLGLDVERGDFVHDIGRADMCHLHHAGGQSGGVDGSDQLGGIYVRERTLDQPYLMSHSETFDLPWRLPDWFSMPEPGRLLQVANNDHARVLRTTSQTGDTLQWLVFDKSAGAWTSVPVSTFRAGGDVRLLGRWLVREDVKKGVDRAEWRDAPGADPGPVPFWSAKIRRGEDPFWSAKVRADVRRRTPTGWLHFYNTRTGRLSVHNAGNLDSETLLVDNNNVANFRVGDELRRGRLTDEGLADEEVVARAPELLAVHWLFRAFD